MLKLNILVPRRDGVTRAEFRHHLVNVHGPLILGEPTVVRDFRRYQYNFVVDGAADDAFGHPVAAEFDGITQICFDSRAALLRNLAEPRYRDVIRPDEARFAGAGAQVQPSHEVAISQGDATQNTVFYLRRRRDGLTRAEFQSFWRAGFTEIVCESAEWRAIVSRSVQNHALSEEAHPNGTDSRYFDLIDEICLRPGCAIGQLRESATLIGQLRQLEQALLDRARTRVVVTQRVIMIP
jgi:hypothetical protein